MSGFNIVHFYFAACNLCMWGLKMCIKKKSGIFPKLILKCVLGVVAIIIIKILL